MKRGVDVLVDKILYFCRKPTNITVSRNFALTKKCIPDMIDIFFLLRDLKRLHHAEINSLVAVNAPAIIQPEVDLFSPQDHESQPEPGTG